MVWMRGLRSLLKIAKMIQGIVKKERSQKKRNLEKKSTLIGLQKSRSTQRGHWATIKRMLLNRRLTKDRRKTKVPTYIKIHKDHVEKETLDHFDLPWKWDLSGDEYAIIPKEFERRETSTLFEHTRALREGKKFPSGVDSNGKLESKHHPDEPPPATIPTYIKIHTPTHRKRDSGLLQLTLGMGQGHIFSY
ncbi:hypothetical protein IWX47DRAFT_556135 [Phyllosticta citricarpa]